jgi:hypothetical protein
MLYSIIINYKCSGCYYCCYYYKSECDEKWLCDFDFSKTPRNDYDIYFRFFSQQTILDYYLNLRIDKQSYRFINEWPIVESESIWEFTAECLKDLFANKLKIE